MKLASLFPLCCALGACDLTETTAPSNVALADLNATLEVKWADGKVTMTIMDSPCASVQDRVTALLDGTLGDLSRDATWVSDTDFGNDASYCIFPSVGWDVGPPSGGTSTFEITDNVTTWTLAVDDLGVKRTLQPVDPVPTYHPGDVLQLRMAPGAGQLSGGIAFVTAGNEKVLIDGESGIAYSGTRVDITLPALASLTTLTNVSVVVYLDIEPVVVECTGPAHCRISSTTASATLTIAMEP